MTVQITQADREHLAATVGSAFPGKAEWLLDGNDDLLFDAKDALIAIATARIAERERCKTIAIQFAENAETDVVAAISRLIAGTIGCES